MRKSEWWNIYGLEHPRGLGGTQSTQNCDYHFKIPTGSHETERDPGLGLIFQITKIKQPDG